MKNLSRIVGGFIYRDPINGIRQKISSLWENEWSIYLIYERASREYKKQEAEYWNKNIHESTAKRPKIGTEQPDGDAISGDLMVDDMTAEEIKSKLKEKGITTRLRSLKKL